MSRYKIQIKLNVELSLQDYIEYFKSKGVNDFSKVQVEWMFNNWPSPEPFFIVKDED